MVRRSTHCFRLGRPQISNCPRCILPFKIALTPALGVMRKGCVIEALRKFIISQGPSKNINNLEWASFWAENKKVIDPIAKRFTCISTEDRYCCFLTLLIAEFLWHLWVAKGCLFHLIQNLCGAIRKTQISERNKFITLRIFLWSKKMHAPSNWTKRYCRPWIY